MCAVCGCGTGAGHDHEPGGSPETHDHAGPGDRAHGHETASGRTVVLEQRILARNDQLAGRNRAWLQERDVLALNLMSSPGSGKTTLLERTIGDLGGEMSIAVIEGDQETPLDADRIRATGRPVVQINTGSGCHLDAVMVERALTTIDPPAGSVVFIENVGNLVCPALFDLGERARIVIMSVTEGADKPLKYPQMFRGADLIVLNKSDLLPYVNFDVADFEVAVRQINPGVEVVVVSATTGVGMGSWYRQLRLLRG
jgi:hydrogenase nickel incorporation protein HypB